MGRTGQIELRLAERMSRLGTESAFQVLGRARDLERQGKSIIHLEIGEPDFATPSNIVNAGVNALNAGWTHYGPSAGYPELREAIAAEVSRTRGVSVSADEVVVVPGGKPIIFYSILCKLGRIRRQPFRDCGSGGIGSSMTQLTVRNVKIRSRGEVCLGWLDRAYHSLGLPIDRRRERCVGRPFLQTAGL